jgi:hypothetical protein
VICVTATAIVITTNKNNLRCRSRCHACPEKNHKLQTRFAGEKSET